MAAGLIGMGIVCVALLAVRRHIPRLPRAAAQLREGEELARTSS
ncbi:4-hydroxybenzoate transporter [Burkholderia sp. AU4i]|nr:4-hydroxybenzoate transporter [Burkholderia sp. AU4i]